LFYSLFLEIFSPINYFIMNTQKRLLTFVATLMLFVSTNKTIAQANSQNSAGNKPKYKTGIGIKVFPFAVDMKIFSGKRNRAVEFLGYFDHGFRLTGLYEFHGNLNGSGNLKWYVGFGAHGGYYDKDGEEGATAGLDGVIGLDYKFTKMPVALALDWQPSYEFITPKAEFQPNFGGLAIRFAF
jgi:hypothetical protein